MLLDGLLLREPRIFVFAVLHIRGSLVTNTKSIHNFNITVRVLPKQIVQQTTALVHQRNQTSTSRKVLGVLLQVLCQVRNSLRHASHLVFRTARIVVMHSVLRL